MATTPLRWHSVAVRARARAPDAIAASPETRRCAAMARSAVIMRPGYRAQRGAISPRCAKCRKRRPKCRQGGAANAYRMRVVIRTPVLAPQFAALAAQHGIASVAVDDAE